MEVNELVAFKFIEALRNPKNEAIRVSFEYKGLLAVVKTFDPKGDDDHSLKFYEAPERYEKVKSYWNTIEVLDPESEEGLAWIADAENYFWKVIRRIQG